MRRGNAYTVARCCCVAVCQSHFCMALLKSKVNNALLAMLFICKLRLFLHVHKSKKQLHQVQPSIHILFLHANLLTHCKPNTLASGWRAFCHPISFKKTKKKNDSKRWCPKRGIHAHQKPMCQPSHKSQINKSSFKGLRIQSSSFAEPFFRKTVHRLTTFHKFEVLLAHFQLHVFSLHII